MNTPSNSVGWLALVASPIGNLADITLRAIQTLEEVDLIAAEDTRRASILLKHYQIEKPLTSYYKDNEHKKTSYLVTLVQQGKKIAYLTDAGTPCLSDPGLLLIRELLAAGIEPRIIPGVSALSYAITACAMPLSTFNFYGFLPRKKEKRRKTLISLIQQGQTIFIYESPHRLGRLIQEINDYVGPDTVMTIIREATKLYEEHLRGTAAEILGRNAGRKWKGEITVAIAPIKGDGTITRSDAN